MSQSTNPERKPTQEANIVRLFIFVALFVCLIGTFHLFVNVRIERKLLEKHVKEQMETPTLYKRTAFHKRDITLSDEIDERIEYLELDKASSYKLIDSIKEKTDSINQSLNKHSIANKISDIYINASSRIEKSIARCDSMILVLQQAKDIRELADKKIGSECILTYMDGDQEKVCIGKFIDSARAYVAFRDENGEWAYVVKQENYLPF